ncbi:MAG: hypothetical protein R6X25_10215 [Candidatus Krumholzibacteriia bacterium]
MTGRCLTLEEILRAQSRGSDDADRQHLQACASCQALSRAHALFLELRDLPPQADLPDARERLATFITREVGDERPRRRHLAPVLPLGVAAALVLTVGLAVLTTVRDGTPPAVIPRGEAAADSLLRLQPPEPVPDGVRLTWSAPGLAQDSPAYRIVIIDARREVVATLEAGTDTTLVVDTAGLPDAAGSRPPLFARVIATADGREVGRSQPRALPR